MPVEAFKSLELLLAGIWLFKVNNQRKHQHIYIYIIFKVNNKDTRTRQDVVLVSFIINFEHTSHIVLVFQSLIWADKCQLDANLFESYMKVLCCFFHEAVSIIFSILAGIYLFKVNHGNTWIIWKIRSKLTIKAPEQESLMLFWRLYF